ncbi:MAG: oligosaccharide flippase family protein [Muribaculaceae bacterium]|nr:oligosaccharide flippase family protein [Muribaculaceae bacterium]
MKPKRNRMTAVVLKAMGVFSGVQMANIGCSIVRTKLVALWIGAAGVGLFGIYNSAIDMISTLTLLSIGVSAVRDLAAEDERERISYVARIVKRWGLLLGLVGIAVMLIASPLLSRLSFGDSDHTAMFCLLSPVVLIMALTSTRQAVLQGLRQLKRLARASVIGAIAGVALSVPLFYWLRLDGIVPSIAIAAFALFVAVWFNSRRQGDDGSQKALTWRELWNGGRGFIALGILMTISNFATMLSNYAFISWLNVGEGTVTTGLFQAGFTLFNRYIGLIFTAISVEFYPRLSSVAKSRRRTSAFVSHELRLVSLILMCALAVFIPLLPWIVQLLYSEAFMQIVPFVSVAVCGTVLRALSWCMAFTMLARGDGKAYLATEITSAVLYFALNVLSFKLYGLIGLGYAYIVWYALYTLAVAAVYRYRYRLWLSPKALLLNLGVFCIITVLTLTLI